MTSYLRQKWQSFQIGTSESEDVQEEALNSENREEIERSKIGIMRAVVQAQDPSAKDIDDLMIRRFLRARDLDVEKASAMLLKYLKWRKEFVPNGFISPAEIPNDLAHNKLFMQGYDKRGRPIVVVFAAKHKPTTVEEFKRFVTFTLDKICARMPSGHEKFTSIADLQGWGYANRLLPREAGEAVHYHAPYIFMTAWKMVYPFIDKNTKKKIIFVEDKKLQSTLLQDIDESQLPETFGGKTKLVPIQEC
ncbi:UNVERIFIED_CONTAM: Patellin-6 [Sesamum calycinum]|uniref:Patellin-6 n=1 Tax=Sesamum calycinum TaxID=2727403 RepID=A0AAW2IZC4_9LAMI